jgi:hypothetical protein
VSTREEHLHDAEPQIESGDEIDRYSKALACDSFSKIRDPVASGFMVTLLRRANAFLDRHAFFGLALTLTACVGVSIAIGQSTGTSLKTAAFVGVGVGAAVLVERRRERRRH